MPAVRCAADSGQSVALSALECSMAALVGGFVATATVVAATIVAATIVAAYSPADMDHA